MAAPSGPETGSSPPAKAKWSRWRKLFAAIGVLILVVVTVDVAFVFLDGLPPEVLASSGPRETFIDAVLMTFYAPTIPGAVDVTASAFVALPSGFHTTFAWTNVTGAGVPVRFVLSPSGSFASGPANGFEETGPALGATTFGIDRPGRSGAWDEVWRMNYTVRELSAWEGFLKTTWIQVDYRLTPVAVLVGDLPLGNVTVPGPADRMATGVTDPIDVDLTPGYVESLQRSLTDFPAPSSPFHHAFPPLTFDAGAAGSLAATLVSSFQWAKGDDCRVTLSFSGQVNGTLAWSWDARFGSLLATFTA